MKEEKCEIRELGTPPELDKGYSVLKQLRTELSLADFLTLYKRSRVHDGYRLIGIFLEERCMGVMGVRVLYDFVHGKHLYVDDLVVIQNHRSRGYGAKLLKYAEEIVDKEKCVALRLCTGHENDKAKKFYEREGWSPRSVAYKKKLSDELLRT